jgi:hypothetical protein
MSAAEAFHAHHGIRRCLRSGREHGTECDVGRTLSEGCFQLHDVVRGNAERELGHTATCNGYRNVFLSEVHAIGSREQCEVGAIVQHEGNGGGTTQRCELACQRQRVTRGRQLGTQLQ